MRYRIESRKPLSQIAFNLEAPAQKYKLRVPGVHLSFAKSVSKPESHPIYMLRGTSCTRQRRLPIDARSARVRFFGGHLEARDTHVTVKPLGLCVAKIAAEGKSRSAP